MDNALYALLDSESIDGDNLSRYSNSDVDANISEARSTEDRRRLQQLYRDAEAQALKDVAYVPINWRNGQIVYTDKVGDLVQTPLQFVLYENVTLSS